MPKKGKKSSSTKLAEQRMRMQQRRRLEREVQQARGMDSHVGIVSSALEERDVLMESLMIKDSSPLHGSEETVTSVKCPKENITSVDKPKENHNRMNWSEKSNNSIKCPVVKHQCSNQSNISLKCPNQSNISLKCPNQSNISLKCPNKSNNSIKCPNQSNISIKCPDKSSNSIEHHEHSNNSLKCPNQSNSSLNCPYQSNSSLNCPYQSNSSLNCPNKGKNSVKDQKEKSTSVNHCEKKNSFKCSKESNTSVKCYAKDYNPVDSSYHKTSHFKSEKIADVIKEEMTKNNACVIKGLNYADVVKGVKHKDEKGFDTKTKYQHNGPDHVDTNISNFDSYINLQGSFHQGDTVRFGSNAGKQCVANCFVALMCSKIKPTEEWNTEYLDSILINGNTLYSHIHGPNDLLLVNDVPETIEIFDSVVQCTKDESINAILGDVDPSFPCGLPLDQALQTALIDSDGCLISVNGFTSLVINQRGHLYLFDSHSRDLNGRSDITGSSIVIHLDSISHLYDILRAFINNNRNCIFEITGVKVNILSDTYNSSGETEPRHIEHIHNAQMNESDMEVDHTIETMDDCIVTSDNVNAFEEFDKNVLVISDEPDNQYIGSMDSVNMVKKDSSHSQIVDNDSDLSDIEVLESLATQYHFKPLDVCSKRNLCRKLKIPEKHITNKKLCRDVSNMGDPKETKSITGDGNCLFRAISYAVSQRQEFYPQVRKTLVNHILNNADQLASFIELPYQNVEEHVNKRKMNDNNVWGTALEILAAADLLKTDIYTFYRGKWIKYSTCQINDQNKPMTQSIYLKHIEASQHYEVVLSVELDRNEILIDLIDDKVVPPKKYKIDESLHEKQVCKTDINSKFQKRENQRLRYAHNTQYKKQKKMQSTARYKHDDYFRINLKEKYSENETYRNKLVQKGKDKYKTNEDYRSDLILKSKAKYKTNADFRSDLLAKSKEKYKTNADFRSDVIKRGKMKYNNDDVYKESLIDSSKQKYQKDNEHKLKIKNQTQERRLEVKKNLSNIDAVVNQFRKNAKMAPDCVCSCCFRLLFENQVIHCNKLTYDQELAKKCISDRYLHKCSVECDSKCTMKLSNSSVMWVCYTCHRKLQKGEMPAECFSNDLELEEVPDELNGLNSLEQHLIALNIPFLKIVNLPKGKQQAVSGPVVSVPSDIRKVTNTLPRTEEESLLVKVKLKRRLQYKGFQEYQFVDAKHVDIALEYLLEHNIWYSDIMIDGKWLKHAYEPVIEEQLLQSDNDELEELQQSTKLSDTHENVENDQVQEKESYLDDGLRGLQLDTCLQPADIGQEALDCYFDQVFNLAPAEGNNPVSLLQEDGIEAKSFPCHFPSGKNTLNEKREKKLSILRYFNLRLTCADNRFARDTSYIFFCQYMSELDRVMSNVQISLRKECSFNGRKITNDILSNENRLKELFKKDEAVKFLKPVRGTPPYWQAAQKDIFAMIRQLGIPTFFCSFSSADFRWSEIVEAILKQQGDKRNVEDLNWDDKCKILRSNPVTMARMFDHRFHSFLKTVILSDANPIGHVIDYFYRVEFQQRGSPHTHCLFWIENAPKFEEDDDETVTEFIDKYITCRLPSEETEKELHDIVTTVQQHSKNHSKSCRKKGTTCRFNFPRPPSLRTYISTPSSSETEEAESDTNVAKEKLENIWKLINDSENESITTEELFNLANVSQEEFEQCFKVVTNRNTVVLKRNKRETFINQYNPDLLRAWDANIDIQFILDAYSCVVYIISYISKAERELGLVLQQTKNEAVEGNLSAQQTMKKVGTAYLHHREISAQEAVFRVTGLRLKECSRKVEFIPVGDNPCRLSIPLKDLKRKQLSNKSRKENEDIDVANNDEHDDDGIWLKNKNDCYKARPNKDVFI